jgi:hypothetical protein
MVYTIKIDDSSKQAQSIINLLNTLAKDYDFLKIFEEEDYGLSPEQEAELDRRYELFLKNPEKGKSWEEVKANL